MREKIAEDYFQKVLSSLKSVAKEENPDEQKSVSNDQLTAFRFYPHMKEIRDDLAASLLSRNRWIRESEENPESASDDHRLLSNQWKIEKATKSLNRQSREESVDLAEALTLEAGTWSQVKVPPNGNVSFYEVKGKTEEKSSLKLIADQVSKVQALLGDEVQRHLMRHVLDELKAKNALSLAYLKTPSESNQNSQEEATAL